MTARKPMTMNLGQGYPQLLPDAVGLQLTAATLTDASLNMPHGTAPAAPVDGDAWTTTAGFYARINGVTVGPFAAAGGVLSFNTRTGAVTLTSGDVTAALGFTPFDAAATLAILHGGTGATTAGGARTNLGLDTAATLAFDIDGTLTANSDLKIATQKAVKTYVDVAVAGSQIFGFGLDKDLSSGTLSAAFVEFVSGIAWSIPAGMGNCSIKNTGTAPSAQTDFDLQVAGVSVGTIRFASSANVATFIKASNSAVASGVTTQIVLPSTLNGMTGRLFGSIVGTR
jgi:hypothetical protein